MKHMSPETVEQYKTEERALMAKRLRLAKYQVKELMQAMMHDELSLPKHIHHLKMDLYNYYGKRFFKVQEYGGGSPSLFGYNIQSLIDFFIYTSLPGYIFSASSIIVRAF